MVMDLSGLLGLCPAPAPTPQVLVEPEPVALPPIVEKLPIGLVAHRCKTKFGRFVREFFHLVQGRQYSPNQISETIIAALQDVADGKIQRLLICCPPGVAKSTLIALYSAWRLARDPSWQTISTSHAYELAAITSRRVRRLVISDEFKAMFGVELRADENREALWATTNDGRFIIAGRDTGITGKRAKEAICDDLLSANERYSKADKDGAWEFLVESLTNRLDGDAPPMIVIGQRLAKDDPQGRLLALGGWHLVELPAEDDAGNLLAPEILPRAKLDREKATSASNYACQYLQKPASDDDAIVKRAWWRFHRPANVPENTPRPLGCTNPLPAVETPRSFDRIVIAVDMTFGSLKGDYAVAQVWGSKGGGRYLLEQWRKKASIKDQEDAIKALTRKYPHAKVIIEKAAGGSGSIPQLTALGVPNIVPVMTGGKDKATRLGLVSGTIEGGNAYLPLGWAGLGEYVEELSGASSHDDAMDATAYALAEMNVSASVMWPELRARAARAEALAKGEQVQPEVDLGRKLVSMMTGIPYHAPGSVRDLETGALRTGPCPQGHLWGTAPEGHRWCIDCGAKP